MDRAGERKRITLQNLTMNAWNTLDLAAGIVVLLGLIIGFRRGLIGQLVSIAGLVAAYLLAYLYYDDLAPWLGQWLPLPSFDTDTAYGSAAQNLHLDRYFLNAVSFLAVFLGVKLLISAAGAVLNIFSKLPGLNFVNKWTGALLGAAEAAVIVVLAVNVMTILPSAVLQDQLKHSASARFILEHMPTIVDPLKDIWPQRQTTEV